MAENWVVKYEIADSEIAKLRSEYMGLTVASIEDKRGFDLVRAARMDVREKRCAVERTRKALKAEALEYGRTVDGEAKRLTALLEPIETHLENQERIITEEVERRRAAKETAEKARLQARIDTLQKFGAKVDVEMIRGLSDAEFSEEVAIAKDEWQTAEDRRKAEEAETMKRAAEQEKARKLLEAERAAAEEAKREADAARAKAERAIRDAQEAERAAAAKIQAEKEKAEAVERARIAEAERIKREAEEKARRTEDAANAEAERLAREKALMPVKQKILCLAAAIEAELAAYANDTADLLLCAKTVVEQAVADLRELAK